MISEAPHRKILHLLRQESAYLKIEVENHTLKVPYADTFVVRELWEVTPTLRGCLLRMSMRVEFLKAVTYFKDKILAGAEQGIRDYMNTWLQAAQDKARELALSKENSHSSEEGDVTTILTSNDEVTSDQGTQSQEECMRRSIEQFIGKVMEDFPRVKCSFSLTRIFLPYYLALAF